MFNKDHLTLKFNRIDAGQKWACDQEGLAFLFLKNGLAKWAGNRFQRRLGPGDILVIKGRSGGKVSVAGRSRLVFTSFCISLEHLFPLLAAREIPLLQGVVESLQGMKVYSASAPLARECHRLLSEVPEQGSLGHRAQLVRIAAVILNEEFKAAQAHRTVMLEPADTLRHLFEKLSLDDLMSLSVGELALKFGCSRRHLNRLFRQHLGYSVSALRMEMRLLRAVSLLRDPHAKVINVAGQCGFNHLGLFNVCFRRRFGTTPSHWKREPLQEKVLPGLGQSLARFSFA